MLIQVWSHQREITIRIYISGGVCARSSLLPHRCPFFCFWILMFLGNNHSARIFPAKSSCVPDASPVEGTVKQRFIEMVLEDMNDMKNWRQLVFFRRFGVILDGIYRG